MEIAFPDILFAFLYAFFWKQNGLDDSSSYGVLWDLNFLSFSVYCSALWRWVPKPIMHHVCVIYKIVHYLFFFHCSVLRTEDATYRQPVVHPCCFAGRGRDDPSVNTDRLYCTENLSWTHGLIWTVSVSDEWLSYSGCF